MKRLNAMIIRLLAVSVLLLYHHSRATSLAHYQKWRLERLQSNSTDTLDKDGDETRVAEINVVPDGCNISITNNERVRRSILYSFSNSTTTETPLDTTVDLSILSPEFKNCTHVYVENGCYEKLSNGSVYVPAYEMVFDRSNYLINHELLFICPDFFHEYMNTDKFSEDIRTVSLVCAAISMVCIVLHIIMFFVVRQLRNLPGYCLLSLCTALLIAYICTFLQNEASGYTGCAVLGMFLMYFYLASFFWMNSMAYDVWKSIRMATTKLRLTTDRPIMVQFARYSFYAWGTPLIIVIISIIIHFSAPESSKYRLIFDDTNCWFKYKQALTLYFAGPLFTLIGVNVLFFASSFYMISSAAMNTSQSKSQGSSDLWSRLFLSLRLGSVMGFMWIFGIIAIITKQEWLWYLYSVCSALQGVFIFFSFTVSERTRKVCKKALNGRKCSTMPTQTTSQQGTSF